MTTGLELVATAVSHDCSCSTHAVAMCRFEWPVMRRLPTVRRLIERQSYFALHAPRQVGKTTARLTLANELTAEGQHVAVLLSVEVGADFPDDVGAAELAILGAMPCSTACPPSSSPRPGPTRRLAGASALRSGAGPAPRPATTSLQRRRMESGRHDETIASS